MQYSKVPIKQGMPIPWTTGEAEKCSLHFRQPYTQLNLLLLKTYINTGGNWTTRLIALVRTHTSGEPSSAHHLLLLLIGPASSSTSLGSAFSSNSGYVLGLDFPLHLSGRNSWVCHSIIYLSCSLSFPNTYRPNSICRSWCFLPSFFFLNFLSFLAQIMLPFSSRFCLTGSSVLRDKSLGSGLSKATTVQKKSWALSLFRVR